MPTSELERIKAQGGQQVQLLRQQLIRELRQSLGAESVHRAGDLVRDFVSDPAEQSATVDRFLDELDEMAPSSTVFADAATAKLRAASRESVATVVEQFDGVVADLDADGLTKLGRRSGIGGEAAAPRAGAGQASGRPLRGLRCQGAARRATAVAARFPMPRSTYSRPLCRSAGRRPPT